jgi:WD40 repeat protein
MGMNFSYGLSTALIGAAIVVVQSQVAVAQVLDEQTIGSMAKDVTVVINGQNPGSGVIISREKNTYYVLTAKHVVATQDQYEIVTPDAKSYPLDYRTVRKLPGLDLAIAQFTSSQSYHVAPIGDSDAATEGTTVYTSGWPHPGRAITERIYQLTQGRISGRPLKPLEDGYALVYTNITRSGMSGGPVLDAQGRVVGIHGRAEGEPVFNPDTGASVDVKSGFNLGIPINSFVNLASQAGIKLSYLGNDFSTAKTITGHSSWVTSVAISPDGQTLASSSEDKTIKLWNLRTGELLHTLTGHSDKVTSVAISSDGQTLASGSLDKTIKLWNLNTGQLLGTFTGHSELITSVAISPDSQTLASSSGDDTVKIWDLNTGKLRSSLSHESPIFGAESSAVLRVAFSRDGKILASASNDKTIKIWDWRSGELRGTLTEGNREQEFQVIALSPYGEILASGNSQGTIKIWNRSTAQLLRTLKEEVSIAPISSVAINPFGQILASTDTKGNIKIWNLYTGQLLRSLDAGNVQMSVIAFSADGQTLVSGDETGTLKIWRLVKQ